MRAAKCNSRKVNAKTGFPKLFDSIDAVAEHASRQICWTLYLCHFAPVSPNWNFHANPG